MQVKPVMECRFKTVPRSIAGAILLLLVCQVLGGCPSFRIEKAAEGAAVRPPPSHFVAGKTTLAEVLKVYGAPAEVVDMKDRFFPGISSCLLPGRPVFLQHSLERYLIGPVVRSLGPVPAL